MRWIGVKRSRELLAVVYLPMLRLLPRGRAPDRGGQREPPVRRYACCEPDAAALEMERMIAS